MTIHSDGRQSGSTRLVARRDGPTRLRSLSRTEIDAALDSDRRREIVRSVGRADEPIALRTLVARLAAAEHDRTAVTTLLERRQRVYISLRRTHLPLLEEYGIVTYDRDRSVVSPGANLAAIDAALDTDEEPLIA